MITMIPILLSLGQGSLCGTVHRVEGTVKLRAGTVTRSLTAKDLGSTIRYGDLLKVDSKGLLVTQIGRRKPRIWKPSPKWQIVLPESNSDRVEVDRARRATFATMASKGGDSKVGCDFAFGFALSLPDAPSKVAVRIEQFGETLWQGDFAKDADGLYSNRAAFSSLASATRSSALNVTAGGVKMQVFLRSSNIESAFWESHARVELVSDADERALMRLELLERFGLPHLAASQLRRLTKG